MEHYTVSDINRVESIQRSFTKTVNYLHFSNYKERLVNLASIVYSVGVSKSISCSATNYYMVLLT